MRQAERFSYAGQARFARASAGTPVWDAMAMTMPRGYSAAVTERGANLSGGQRQRVALAQVFLKNPPILILDKATSALDTTSERAVQQAIAIDHLTPRRLRSSLDRRYTQRNANARRLPMPKVFILNGPSSSGKTSTAKAMLSLAVEPLMRFSLDDCYALFSQQPGNGWQSFQRISRAFYHSVCPWIESGFNVVVDTVLERRDCYDAVKLLYDQYDLYFVGLYCGLEELEHRERLRTNRRIGQARSQHSRVHSHCHYDLKLNTEASEPTECARLVLTFFGKHQCDLQGSGSTRDC